MIKTFIPQGVCSKKITIEIEGDIIKNISFEGGCNGNLKGIGILCKGMTKQEVIQKLKGVRCGFKNTSCPDQLTKALEEI